MGKEIMIGLSGLAFLSENKGCSALAYAILGILKDAAQQLGVRIKLMIISYAPYCNLDLQTDEVFVHWESVEFHLSNIRSQVKVYKALSQCEFILDFTEGDSFTDIYGNRRFLSNVYLKTFILIWKKKLVLGPQTYGPFKQKWSRLLAGIILRKSMFVFSRDQMSSDYVYELAGFQPETIIDVAFALPYTHRERPLHSRTIIGLNVSGLLWNGGYMGDNQFGLNVDYPSYCRRVLAFLTDNQYEIHLVPHVICNAPNSPDNDVAVCEILQKEFPKTVMAPSFLTPMEAKSYISGLDIFIGARMHATIAAFSSGVAVIPFSYSRKFEGLYDTLKYPYCISGKELTTDQAVEKTVSYLLDWDELKKGVDSGQKIARDRLNQFKNQICSLLAGDIYYN